MSQTETAARRAVVRNLRLTRRDEAGWLRVHVEGELDLAVAGRLRPLLAEAEGGRSHVAIDLDACDFIDLSVVALLIAARRELAGDERDLLVRHARGQVRRMLVATGLAACLEPRREAAPRTGRPAD